MSDAIQAGDPVGLSADERAELLNDVDEARRRVNAPDHPLYSTDALARETRLVELSALLRRAGIGPEDEKMPSPEELAAEQFQQEWSTASTGPSETAKSLLAQHLALAAGEPGHAREADERALRRRLGDEGYRKLVADAERAAALFDLKQLPPEALASEAALKMLAGHAQYRDAHDRARQQAKF